MTTTANSAIDKTTSLITSTKKALSTSYDLVNTANSVLRSVRSQADASTQATIDSLLDTLGKLSGSTASGQMQTPRPTPSTPPSRTRETPILEDDTNVLNIDTSAELQSVTSNMNPAPSSLQFILRTKEISVDDDKDSGVSDQGRRRRRRIRPHLQRIQKAVHRHHERIRLGRLKTEKSPAPRKTGAGDLFRPDYYALASFSRDRYLSW